MAFYNETRMPWGSKPIYIVCRACGNVDYCPFKTTYEGIPVYSHQCTKCCNWTKFMKPEQAHSLWKYRMKQWKKQVNDIPKKKKPINENQTNILLGEINQMKIRQKQIEQSQSNIQKKLENQRFDVAQEVNKIVSEEINHYVTSFSHKFAHRVELMAQQEVRRGLSEKGLREYITAINKDVVGNHKEIMKVVVEEVLKKLNSLLREELRITKEITYSIEKEIKQTYFNSNLSFDCTKKIYERVKDKLKLPDKMTIGVDGEPKKLTKND